MATSGYLRLEIKGYSIEEIVKVLQPKWCGSVFTKLYEHEGRTVLGILMGLKYSWWNDAETGVTIILRREPYKTVLEVIGFAGKRGFGDGGRNKNIVRDVEKILVERGFPVVRVLFTELAQHYRVGEDLYPMIESIPGDER